MIPNPLKLLNPANWYYIVSTLVGLLCRLNGLACGLIVIALSAWLLFGDGSNYGDIPYYIAGIGGVNILYSVFK
jgi:uncharacterized membrane protein YuzA (DUF378 family)